LIPARSLQQFLDGRPECHDDDDQTEPAPSTNVRTIGGRRKGTYQLPRARGERRG
jgi:hypothetical protein